MTMRASFVLVASLFLASAHALSPSTGPLGSLHKSSTVSKPNVVPAESSASLQPKLDNWMLSGLFAASFFLVVPVQASEIGVEVEAPTLYTGESVMICKKRGPLGACLESVVRTDDNDNDRAKKYFSDPTVLIKRKEDDPTMAEGNALIERLKQQSKDNSEKNELEVQRKTFQNNQGAIVGPFSRQVLIMNTDEQTFTLLDSPQAMRLKDAGFIKDRKFVKQPTQEELDSFLEAPASKGNILQSIFGGEQ